MQFLERQINFSNCQSVSIDKFENIYIETREKWNKNWKNTVYWIYFRLIIYGRAVKHGDTSRNK